MKGRASSKSSILAVSFGASLFLHMSRLFPCLSHFSPSSRPTIFTVLQLTTGHQDLAARSLPTSHPTRQPPTQHNMADHLCPRLTFPQAPCFSCLSKSIPSMAPSSEFLLGFPMPPSYVIEAGKRVQQRRSWPKGMNSCSNNHGIFNMSGDAETRAKAIFKLNQLLQLDQPRRDSETIPARIQPTMQAT